MKADRNIDLSHESLELLLSVVETPEAVISGAVLADYFGSASNTLISSGLLKPNGHEAATASQVDHDDMPISLSPLDDGKGYGYFSPAGGWVAVPNERIVRLRVEFPALLSRMMVQTDLSSRSGPIALVPDLLWEMGDVRLPGRGKRVPVWVARRLSDPTVWNRFIEAVKTRPAPGLRIVLSMTPENRLPAQIHQGHSIIAVRDVANQAGGFIVDPDLLAARVATGSQRDDALITIAADGAVVIVRGKPYRFPGSKQQAVIRHLYEAMESGRPDCPTVELLEAAGYRNSVNILAKAFSGREDWREFIEEKDGRCRMFT